MTKRTLFLVAVVVVVLLWAERAVGKGKPAPGPQPPPDPVIAYVVQGQGGSKDGLWVMDSNGSNKTRVFPGNALSPSFSPDGSAIAFLSDVVGTGVYVVGIDGSNPHRVVASTYLGGGTSWSSDGWIAFVERGDAGYDILVVRPDGSGVTNLTQTPDRQEFSPAWSASGNLLAIKAFETPVDVPTTDQPIVVYSIALAGGFPTITGETDVTNVPGSPLAGARGVAADFAHLSDLLVIDAQLPGELRSLRIVDLRDLASPRRFTAAEDDRQQGRWCEGDTRIVFRAPYRNDVVLWSTDVETGLDLMRLGDRTQGQPACLR